LVVSTKQAKLLSAKALVVDDDPDFRRILVRRAKKMGLSVVEASNGKEAISVIEKEKFDVLVADLYMPGCTGLEVVRAAQKIDPTMQAIVLTGSATLETAVEALRAGVYDYLTKPLESMAVFEMTLARALERKRLIEENKRLFREVQRLAMTDPLTGLYNRHKVSEALAMEVERAARYGRPLSIIVFDLDRLKEINDTYGHAAGDSVLQAVAKAIRAHIRRVDLPARIGGDEFLVVLPEADLAEARRVAERITSQLAQVKVGSIGISLSAGVGQWAISYGSARGFLHAVDQAMYQAKRSGGRRLIISEPPTVNPEETIPHLKRSDLDLGEVEKG